VAKLAAAGERLVQAQAGTLGGGGPSAFAAARAEHADVVRELTGAAADLLAEAGRPATQASVERIARTLRAASLDEQTRQQLLAGRLADDVEATGFTLLAGLDLPQPSPRRAKPDRQRKSDLRARLRELRREAAELQRASGQAREEARRAREQAEEAEQRAAAADERWADAAHAVSELEQELERPDD
jgi:chromosome segregation ATPase